MRTHSLDLLFIVIVLTLSASSSALAQWVNTSSLSVAMVTGLAVRGSNMFAGLEQGGAYHSSDGGEHWIPADTGLWGMHISGLAVNERYVFAGTHKGVSRSSDNGTTWEASSNGLYGFVGADSVAYPPNVRALATNGPYLFASIYDCGVFRSSNNGDSWETANSGLPANLHVTHENIVEAFGVNGADLFAGTLYGVFRSTDNGASWTEACPSMTSTSFHAFAESGTFLFAGSGVHLGTVGESIFRSSDYGASWVNVSTGVTSPRVICFAVSGTNLFAGTFGEGVFLSTDNGANWTDVSAGLMESHVLALAVYGGSVYAGTQSGLWRRPLSEVISGVEGTFESVGSTAKVYPNPSQVRATIHFTTKVRGHADVRVVNVLGEPVAQLFEGVLDAGEHAFTWEAPRASHGAYFAVIRQGGKVARTQLMFVR